MSLATAVPPKAPAADFLGRFREIVSDPLNLLIERHPLAGSIEGNVVVLHNGLRVPVVGPRAYYGDFAMILVVNRGVHEPVEEYAFQVVLDRLPERPTMLELGAYWGHYSMWLKQRRPDATVHLVEPHPENLAAGAENFARAGFSASFHQALVGPGAFEVDGFLESAGIERLEVLHSDIQGAELAMLDGAARALGRHAVDYAFVSTHSTPLHAAVADRLQRFGYRIEVSSSFEGTTSHDGFLLATSPCVARVFEAFPPLDRDRIARSTPAELLAALAAVRPAPRPGA
jgi:hypothetical protein